MGAGKDFRIGVADTLGGREPVPGTAESKLWGDVTTDNECRLERDEDCILGCWALSSGVGAAKPAAALAVAGNEAVGAVLK